MSGNIHSIRDFSNNRGQGRQGNPPPDQYSSPPLLGAGMSLGTPDSARKESFWDMLKFLFCPFFGLRSFIFVVTVLDIIMFIASFYDGFDGNEFLTPKPQALDELGAKDAHKMQEGEVYRFLTACFLHANIWHILFNMIMQMILGFRLEPTVGLKHTAVVYLLSGIGGNMLSADCLPDSLGVGASGAIFGMNSAMIAWVIMNWKALEGDSYRLMGLIWLIMILILNLFMGLGTELVDSYAHLGGIIVGFLVGVGIFRFRLQPSRSDMHWKYATRTLLAVYFILGFTLFYTEVNT